MNSGSPPLLTRPLAFQEMRRLATGLLCLAAGLYIAVRTLAPDEIWVGFVLAAAEAAMVGAIADWFAVTALFRHPLGIPIPHTAIIPRRKDAIARQFGRFVQANFLSEAVIAEKLSSMSLSRSVAGWLSRPDNARAVAEQITTLLAGAARVMHDDEIQRLIDARIQSRIRDTSFGPMIGELLTFVTTGRRQQAIIDGAVSFGLRLLDDTDDEIRFTVRRKTPWWFPDSVDRVIYEQIVRAISRTLYEMQTDIYHPLRGRAVQALNGLVHDLKHSEELAKKERELKEELLNEPALRQFIESLWSDIKSSLIRQAESPDPDFHRAIEDAVMQFGKAIREDAGLAGKVDAWVDGSARYLIRTFGNDVAALIQDTIEKWDGDATAERIEHQIGRDLQFIRINGTVVGALVGLAIHTIEFIATSPY